MNVHLCECGCGQATGIVKKTRSECGWKAGEPKRFVHGHHNRLQRPTHKVDADTGCWVWQGSIAPNGYGNRIAAHGGRLSPHCDYYERAKGRIPTGFQVDHLCRNRRCVNPDHLEAVPSVINARRRPTTKLNDADVAEIRSLARASTPYPEIAKRFHIARSTISQIVTGARWKKVS